MISATRSTVALTQTASPACTRAMTVRNPASSVRENATYLRRRSASTRSECSPGSASITFASATAITRPPASEAMIRATAASTTPTRSAGRCRETRATLRATPISARPAVQTFQVAGNRCIRSSTSANALTVAVTPVPRANAISPRLKSSTPGVPSPPGKTSLLPMVRSARPIGPRAGSVGSAECSAAHCASTSRSSTSASRRTRTAAELAASKPAASSSSRSTVMTTTLEGATDSLRPHVRPTRSPARTPRERPPHPSPIISPESCCHALEERVRAVASAR